MNKRILSMLALPLIAMSGAWANGATEGYLPGKFSVSADKQVYFSKGNLQATTTDLGASWTWGFAEHQWDYVGNATANNAINGNGTVSTNGTVDYFGWVGASSTWTGVLQYGISNAISFSTSTSNYGNVADEPLKSDWGKVFGDDNTWSTLSIAEWQYLLNNGAYANETRANKYGIGTVHGTLGLIILPDGYKAPSGITTAFVPGTTNTAYSDADWSKMESAGAVFLPAAGYRYGSSENFAGSIGDYWSSSAFDASRAYGVNFDSGNLYPAYYYVRCNGYSVRLVCDEIDPNPKVTWDAANKQGTFTMPAGNVEVSVEYYQPAELAWKQGTADVPEGGVSAYKGFPTTLPALANPNSHTVSYTSSNPAVATIAADGKITLVGAGTTTIQAIFAGDDTYEDKTASYTLNVFLPVTLTLKSSNDAWGTVTAEGASSGNNTIRWTRDVMDVDNTNYLGTGATFSALGITYTCTASESYEGLYTDDDQWEMEDGAYIMGNATFTSTVGKIAHIEIPYSENAFTPSDLAAGWSVSDHVLTWDGEPTETVIFTGGVAGIFSITYTLASEGESAITAIDNGNGTYSIIPGTEVTAKATPADGYHLDCWSNNAEVNDAGTQTFTMGEDDMELTAFFEDNTPINVATFAAANVFTIEGGKAVVKVNADARPLNENQELNVKAGSTITIEAIPGYKIKSVKVKPASHAPEGALPGLFSVSDTKQVYFAKGNLQATTADKGANWTWGFAEHQWDYVGEAAANTAVNGNGTVSTNGTVDLFGWVGASSNFTGAAQYGISNSQTTNNVNGYGNVADEPLKSDWGKVFGDDSPWRTLTGGGSGEWKYLLDTRTTTSGVRYAKACVNGVNGLIIVPDGWSQTTYELKSTNNVDVKYTVNVIALEVWSNLESAGAVFLPAVGYRDGSSVDGAGICGYYWSSSAKGADYAYDVYIGSGYLNPAGSNGRFYGSSVRLVYPVESE